MDIDKVYQHFSKAIQYGITTVRNKIQSLNSKHCFLYNFDVRKLNKLEKTNFSH